MSDIRFNRWLHQSGTGGVYQDSAGNVGIGTSIPTTALDVQGGNLKIGSNTLSSSGVSTFTTLSATNIVGVSTLGVTTAYINTLSGISTIDASSAVSINQNLVFASGYGIDFSATTNSSGTMTSELLSDYEEGSFTPSFGNGGNGTYANRLGRYTKIGNIVTVHVHIQLSSVGTASGNIQVSGFPFTSNSVIYSGTSTLHGNGWSVTRNNLNGLVPPSSTSIDLYYNTGSSGVLIVQHSDVGTGNLLFTVSYQTA